MEYLFQNAVAQFRESAEDLRDRSNAPWEKEKLSVDELRAAKTLLCESVELIIDLCYMVEENHEKIFRDIANWRGRQFLEKIVDRINDISGDD